MTKAFRILLIVSILSRMIACPLSASAQSKSKHVKVQVMDKQMFLASVFNYEKSTWWYYEGDKPCIVTFTAGWSSPCRLMDSIMEEVAKHYDGKIVVYHVDIEKEKELATSFGIKKVPTYLFCTLKGKPKMMTGVISKLAMYNAVEEVLLPSLEEGK